MKSTPIFLSRTLIALILIMGLGLSVWALNEGHLNLGAAGQVSGTNGKAAIGTANSSVYGRTLNVGFNNVLGESNSAMVGEGLTYSTFYSGNVMVVGQYNETSPTSDHYFVVGKGTGTGSNRANAFVVTKSGRVLISSDMKPGGISSNYP